MRFVVGPAFALFIVIAHTANRSDPKSDEVYTAWLHMYDLKFDHARLGLAQWEQNPPEDPSPSFYSLELNRLTAITP